MNADMIMVINVNIDFGRVGFLCFCSLELFDAFYNIVFLLVLIKDS